LIKIQFVYRHVYSLLQRRTTNFVLKFFFCTRTFPQLKLHTQLIRVTFPVTSIEKFTTEGA